QRLGYFTLDKEATQGHLIFNKTVGLRDSWAKQQPQETKPQNQPAANNQPQGHRSAINEIQKISKKYTNLSGAKLEAARADIAKLAEDIAYDELEPLFNTAAKKVGTRIGVMIALGVLLKNGVERNEKIEAFIEAGLADSNELLVAEAKAL
ncbi:MAG: glutamine--tRNA ligase, partial [Fulvivirga sp.]